MIPWYIITLDDEPWKLPQTLKHLAEHGISPKVIHGINGYLAGLRPSTPFAVEKNGDLSYIHPAQLGCALSHIIALTVALSDGAEQFIIAEDDVLLGDDFNEKFDALVKALPEDAQIFQMQYPSATGWYNQIEGGLWECTNAFGTACILWKREAAKQALLMLRPIDSPFDIMLIRKVYPFMKHFISDPPLVQERTSSGEWPSSFQNKTKD